MSQIGGLVPAIVSGATNIFIASISAKITYMICVKNNEYEDSGKKVAKEAARREKQDDVHQDLARLIAKIQLSGEVEDMALLMGDKPHLDELRLEEIRLGPEIWRYASEEVIKRFEEFQEERSPTSLQRVKDQLKLELRQARQAETQVQPTPVLRRVRLSLSIWGLILVVTVILLTAGATTAVYVLKDRHTPRTPHASHLRIVPPPKITSSLRTVTPVDHPAGHGINKATVAHRVPPAHQIVPSATPSPLTGVRFPAVSGTGQLGLGSLIASANHAVGGVARGVQGALSGATTGLSDTAPGSVLRPVTSRLSAVLGDLAPGVHGSSMPNQP